ncbi:MAG: hypothetical protein GEU87_10635 [Alphaproteobacteria bacterium]|nr:hypothetical protein [Alphaproteobacteria bacterium]
MHPFLMLSARWAIGADRQQWIIYRHRAHAARGGQWQALSYIGSTKAVLLRCLREHEAVIGPAVQTALDTLPETFMEWRLRRGERAIAA